MISSHEYRPKSSRTESAPLPSPSYGLVSLLVADDVVVDAEEFPGCVKFPFPPPGSGNVVSEGTVGTAADDPSTEVALALVIGKADKSVVESKFGVDDADAVGSNDEVTLASAVDVPSVSPPSGLRVELAWGAGAVSDERGASQEV